MAGIDMHYLSLVDRPTSSTGKKPESRRRPFLIARIWNAYRKEGGSVSPSLRRRGPRGISHLVPVIKFYVSILLCISRAQYPGGSRGRRKGPVTVCAVDLDMAAGFSPG